MGGGSGAFDVVEDSGLEAAWPVRLLLATGRTTMPRAALPPFAAILLLFLVLPIAEDIAKCVSTCNAWHISSESHQQTKGFRQKARGMETVSELFAMICDISASLIVN